MNRQKDYTGSTVTEAHRIEKPPCSGAFEEGVKTRADAGEADEQAAAVVDRVTARPRLLLLLSRLHIRVDTSLLRGHLVRARLAHHLLAMEILGRLAEQHLVNERC